MRFRPTLGLGPLSQGLPLPTLSSSHPTGLWLWIGHLTISRSQVCSGNHCDSLLSCRRGTNGLWSWSALVNGRVSPSYPTLVRSAQLLEASVACLRSLLSSPASASGLLSPPPHAVPEATNDPKPIRYSRHACLNVRNEKCEMPMYEIDSHLRLKPFLGSPRATP